MQVNYEILELFPTPVYTTMIPVEFSKVIEVFNKEDMNTDSDHNNYGYRSKNSYILDKLECKELAKFILGNVQIFATQLGYDYEEFRFGQSWISIKSPGQHHTAHVHPNSLLSGVLYYGPAMDKTPAIKFHKSQGGTNVSHIVPRTVGNKRDLKYAQDWFSIEFTPGLLVLFPSYLMHSVPLNESTHPRCSLAFNIVPREGFGDERNLTELLF